MTGCGTAISAAGMAVSWDTHRKPSGLWRHPRYSGCQRKAARRGDGIIIDGRTGGLWLQRQKEPAGRLASPPRLRRDVSMGARCSRLIWTIFRVAVPASAPGSLLTCAAAKGQPGLLDDHPSFDSGGWTVEAALRSSRSKVRASDSFEGGDGPCLQTTGPGWAHFSRRGC